MAPKLTAVSIAQAKAKAAPYEIPDGGCPGLRLLVYPTGTKSWLMRFRSPVERDRIGKGKARKLTLGPLGDKACEGEPTVQRPLTLADARALAASMTRQIRQGIDPTVERRAERHTIKAAAPSDKVEDVFADFMAKHVRKSRKGTPIRESTRRKTGRLLGLEPKDGDLGTWIVCKPASGVLAAWHGRPVGGITKRDVLDLLAVIVGRGAPVGANRTLSALKQAFLWCVRRDILKASPCDHVAPPSPEQPQERELSDAELVAIWRAAERSGYPYGDMIRVLLLTGQRLDEVLSAVWSEFDLASRMWVIPGLRTKNGREHHVPLSNQVMAVLEKLPRIKSKAGYLFTLCGDVPCSNLSRLKSRLDALTLEELRKIDPQIAEFAPWRQHHIRHTAKTWMQRARIARHVRNAVQNHRDGDMDELYGHYTFEKGKREALDRWAHHLAEIASGTNIVGLRR
jgi:integrase